MTTTTSTGSGEEVADRQRARSERGLRSSAKVQSDRLPPAPRERRVGLAALAVVLIVGGAAIAALLAIRADSRVPVLVATTHIPVGTEITAGHLGTTPVASDSDLLIPAEQEAELIGRYATVDISEGRLIDTNMTNSDGLIRDGDVIVGALLTDGRMPASGLLPGDVVDLVAVVDGEATVVVREARVSSVSSAADGTGSRGLPVSLIVSRDDAPTVAAIGAAGELAAILLPTTPESGE